MKMHFDCKTACALTVCLLTLGGVGRVGAQDFETRTHTQTAPQTVEREKANAALEAQDYALAAKLLAPLAVASPNDARVLYDLGSAQDALDEGSAAERNYRAAIAADAKFCDPHVALGLLLARAGKLEEARAELLAAVALEDGDKLLRARAYRALARLDSKTRPGAARNELLAALKLSPETPEDTLLTAELAAGAANGAQAAEAEYRRALAARPGDPGATAALAHLLVQQKRAGEAEAMLTTALGAHPDDAALTAQLVAVYAGEGKGAQAIPLAESLHRAQPQDEAVTRLLANLYEQAGDDAKARPLLEALLQGSPADGLLAEDLGRTLIHLKQFPEAQQVLARAVAVPSHFPTPSDMGNTAGDLAYVASVNGDPEGALQALELRATVLPTSAPVLFLTAISHDKLHHVKLAQQAYREFLTVSKGSNPDQEFEAKHRLIALEHMR